jgi:hypothetical protein
MWPQPVIHFSKQTTKLFSENKSFCKILLKYKTQNTSQKIITVNVQQPRSGLHELFGCPMVAVGNFWRLSSTVAAITFGGTMVATINLRRHYDTEMRSSTANMT